MTAESVERGRQVAESMMDRAEDEYRRRMGTPRPPAVVVPVAPVTHGAHMGEGGAVSEAQNAAEAAEGSHVDIVARVLVGSDWDDGLRITDIGSRETVARLAEQTRAALRPVHYREAAASLRAVGHTAAADLLDSTAKDLTEGEPDENL